MILCANGRGHRPHVRLHLGEDRARVTFLLRRQRDAVEVALEQEVGRVDFRQHGARAAASAATHASAARNSRRANDDGRGTAATTTDPPATPAAADEHRVADKPTCDRTRAAPPAPTTAGSAAASWHLRV